MNMKIILLLFYITASVLYSGCNEKDDNTILDPYYQNIASFNIMIAKINGMPFYGNAYVDPSPPSIWVNNTLIVAREAETNNELNLSRYMISANEHPFIHYSSLQFQGNFYYLFTANPYRIIINELADTLISGSFYASFVNDQIADTIIIDNGIYIIKPDVPDDFFVSCSLKNHDFISRDGTEYFERIWKKFAAKYDHFEDSAEVIIEFAVGRLSDNFVNNYNIWAESKQVSVSIQVGAGSAIPSSIYNGHDGYLKIEEMITVVEQDTLTGHVREISKVGKASFELQAINDAGEIITVTQGKYSYNGFN